MFRKITLFSLVLTFFVIIFSSFIRLADTGIACPAWTAWPACQANPLMSDIVNSGFSNAFKNLTADFNPLINGLKKNSYLISFGILGLFVFAMTVSAWLQPTKRIASILIANLLLILITIQFALGYWNVDIKVMPVVVVGHVLLGILCFWLMDWIYLRSHPLCQPISSPIRSKVRLVSRLSMLAVSLQIILGLWLTANLAELVCPDFPQCNGNWLPSVDFMSALNIFSGLETGYTGVLPFEGQVAVHWLHRASALVVFILLTGLMLIATSDSNPKPVRTSGLILSGLLFFQALLGIISIKLESPLVIAVTHGIVGMLLMQPIFRISFYSKYSTGTEATENQEDWIASQQNFESPTALSEETTTEVETYVEPTADSLYLRLQSQLKKTRSGFAGALTNFSFSQKSANDDLFEEIESSLLIADVGIDATSEIINQLKDHLGKTEISDSSVLESNIKQILSEILAPCDQPLVIPEQETPFVILVVGINGVGKTTTIGKLAKRLQNQGHSVMLAAGDTFRAAAVEQLETWGERNSIPVIAQHTGADSASVIFDAVQSAKAKNVDVLIADTAGRLHTKSNLMDELSKIKRIMAKIDQSAPHEVLLVLDAGTGQNALSQTKIFHDAVNLTGIALTKLDGTAKGGVIFALAKQFDLPIRFIGVGEGIDDLQDFNADSFINALFIKD